MRRVDPDALFRAALLRWDADAAHSICPEVEPERPKPYNLCADWDVVSCGQNDNEFECRWCGKRQYQRPTARHDCPERPECDPYCMAGSAPCRKCRERAKAEQPKYDYHADWTRHPDPSGNNDVTWYCKYCDGWTDHPPKARHTCPERPEPVIDEIDEAFDGLRIGGKDARSNACGNESSGSSSAGHPATQPSSSGPPTSFDTAHAADPRRLTTDEISTAIARGDPLCTYRAVADAQLKKARVTISEAEIARNVRDGLTEYGRARYMAALLRSNGVEVTP